MPRQTLLTTNNAPPRADSNVMIVKSRAEAGKVPPITIDLSTYIEKGVRIVKSPMIPNPTENILGRCLAAPKTVITIATAQLRTKRTVPEIV